MIQFIEGDLLESKAEAFVNTVNTVGIMGKGIALQFKNLFPNNYRLYNKACKEGNIDIGKLFVTEEQSLLKGNKIIINFPTKTDWRKPSEYSYIERGLIALIELINKKHIKSVALPPLGAGNGGLDWNKVKTILEKHLSSVNCDVYIYQPNYIVKDVLKKERVKLTPARAMLLSVLYDLVKNGEFVSEFAAEKIAYFLQQFGAKDVFKLDFHPNFYGPYSGKVKHVLYYLNGSYISGYSSKDKKPFEELGLMIDAEKDVEDYLNKPENETHRTTSEKVKKFLSGYYSSFALELLSTVDFIITEKKVNSVDEISRYLENWSNRKKSLFTDPRFISKAIGKIETKLN
jgi:O-acetyl-ADP-ribose deacetylase (regulator of RNase III)